MRLFKYASSLALLLLLVVVALSTKSVLGEEEAAAAAAAAAAAVEEQPTTTEAPQCDNVDETTGECVSPDAAADVPVVVKDEEGEAAAATTSDETTTTTTNATTTTTTGEEEAAAKPEPKEFPKVFSPAGIRLVTEEELSTKTGVASPDSEIWISIMGEVYDVSAGREYYGPGSSYSAFAGRDGSVPFVTGVFTDEESKKGLKDLTTAQLKQLDQWRGFYQKEGKYPFVGLLLGRYYDENGKATKSLRKARKRMKKEAIAQAKEAAAAQAAAAAAAAGTGEA